MNVLCPLCLGKGTYPAKINDRRRGCYKGEAECPCCEGRKMVSEAEQRDWTAKYGSQVRT